MAKKIDRIDSVETLEAKLAEMRTAAAVYSKFTQEQVDEICKQLNFTSLRFHRLDDMIASIGLEPCKLCTYCWSGRK